MEIKYEERILISDKYPYYYFDRKLLGSGAFGRVMEGGVLFKNERIAVKIVDVAELERDDPQSIARQKREYENQIKLKHKNIARLLLFGSSKSENRDKNFYYVLERCDCNLRSIMQTAVTKKDKFSENFIRWVFSQIVEAFIFLKNRKIYHRDLKPENILIRDGVIKICDFGLSISNEIVKTMLSKGIIYQLILKVGTFLYQPYQLLDPDASKYDPEKYDVWSSGILLYELFYGVFKYPFAPDQQSVSIFRLYNLLKDKPKIQFLPERPIDDKIKELFELILEHDENKRNTWEQIKNHPWIRDLPRTCEEDYLKELNQFVS